MTNEKMRQGFYATIRQFYSSNSRNYIEEAQLYFIGGVLQTALHLLTTKDYYELKKHIYTEYGYDPGGVAIGQYELSDYIWGSEG